MNSSLLFILLIFLMSSKKVVKSQMIPYYLGNSLIWIDSQQQTNDGQMELGNPFSKSDRYKNDNNPISIDDHEKSNQIMSVKVVSDILGTNNDEDIPLDLELYANANQNQPLFIRNDNSLDNNKDLMFNGIIEFSNKLPKIEKVPTTSSSAKTKPLDTTTATSAAIEVLAPVTSSPKVPETLMNKFRTTLRKYFNLDNKNERENDESNIRQKISNIIQFLHQEQPPLKNNLAEDRTDSKWNQIQKKKIGSRRRRRSDILSAQTPNSGIESTETSTDAGTEQEKVIKLSPNNRRWPTGETLQLDSKIPSDKIDYDTHYYDFSDNVSLDGRKGETKLQTRNDLIHFLATITDASSLFRKTTCRCGLSMDQNIFNRILLGKDAEINKYPWMVQVVNKKSKSVFCGGSLISDLHVMTAAHCIKGLQPKNTVVRLGHTTTSKNGKVSLVKNFMIHPKYRDIDITSPDIGLIRLKRPITYSTSVLPICLGQIQVMDGESALIAGWGSKKLGGPGSKILQEATVEILVASSCRNISDYDIDEVKKRVLCGPGDGIDSCNGDSGGPLFLERGANFYQAGITSWGYGCGQPEYPGVYTKVSSYLPWIRKKTENGLYCQPDGKNKVTKIIL